MDMPLLKVGWIAVYAALTAGQPAPRNTPSFVYASRAECERDTHQIAEMHIWRIDCVPGTPTGPKK